MAQTKVSVIIPAYNRAAYLGGAIQSVLNQSYPDFEIIVVDDGSTDHTQRIVDAPQDSRIHYIYQQNRGISAAMNTGIASARGEYVARLDSDDLWLPDLLRLEVSVLDTRPDVGVVYAKSEGMDAQGNPKPTIWGHAKRFPAQTLKSMVYGDFTSNITVIARRSCFEKVGLYDEFLRTSEDWDIWLRMARHYEFAFVDRILAKFRLHEKGITAYQSPVFADNLTDRIRVLDKLYASADLPPEIEAMKPIAYRNAFTGNGLLWFTYRQYSNARHDFSQAIRSGGNPLIAVARIVWLVITWEGLSRFAWGRRFNHWHATVRRRWRHRAMPRRRHRVR